MVAREVSRRTILGAAGVGALALVLSPSRAAPAAAASRSVHATQDRLRFGPIAPVANTVDAVTVPDRGKVEQFLAVPVDAETCGLVIDDQDGLVFVAVQHPGKTAPGTRRARSSGGTWGSPRPSVIQVHQT